MLKKLFLVLIVIVLMMPALGLAHSGYDYQMTAPIQAMRFSFSTTTFSFPSWQTYDVYSGPGMEYLRTGDGYMTFSSQEFKYAGRIGDWMFVRCQKNDNGAYGIHYGWIYVPQYSYLIQNIPSLQFSSVTAVTTMNTGFWDTALYDAVGPIARLPAGTYVTYLGSFVDGGMVLAYVETVIYGQKACGFVSLGALQLLN